MEWCFNYCKHRRSNIHSNVLSLGNISSTRTNPVLEAISNGASANRTRLAVATTAGAYTSTAAIGDYIFKFSSNNCYWGW
jgi:hypothetical protein